MPTLGPYRAKVAYRDRQVAATYDAERFTAPYGRFYNRRELHALDLALRWVKPGSSVLDLACGTGRITERLLGSGLKASGTDISLSMMQVAREKSRGAIPFVASDAEALPFQDASFDWVVSVRLFGHVPLSVRARILSEVTRVARCGSIIAFYLLNAVTRTRRYARSLHHPNPDWYPATQRQIVRELTAQGLKVQRIYAVIPVVDQAHIFVATKDRET
jgi:ubiquinone/menaquinone biosynthesis C-methylase UbiE